jgi:hypothetical protein
VTAAVFTLMVMGLKTVGAVAIGPALTAGYISGAAVLALACGTGTRSGQSKG